MKSIEEFATEYAQDKYLPLQTSQAVKAGANYVLDEVKDILFRRYSDDGDPKQRWIDMKKLIESLEK